MKIMYLKKRLILLALPLILSAVFLLMSLAGSTTVTVYNEQDLNNALTNADVDTVKFGNDIVMTKHKIDIETRRSKPALVIDGQGYSFTEYYVDAYDVGAGLRIATNVAKSTLQTVTLKNFNMIYGGNGYGTIYVNESFKNDKAITLIYENLKYEGPQITYNPYGTAVYRNTNITIDFAKKYKDGQVIKRGIYAGEIAEISNVILDSTNEFVKKPDPNGPVDEFFWIKSNGDGIEITPGAVINVVAETQNQATPGGFIYGESTIYKFEVGEGAEFNYSGYRIFTEYMGPQNVTVGANAKVNLSIKADQKPLGNGITVFQIGENLALDRGAEFNLITTGENSYSTLNVGSSLIVAEDAILQVVSLENSKKEVHRPLIIMGLDSVGHSYPVPSVIFNDPKLVLIYNSNDIAKNNYDSALGFYKHGTIKIKSHSVEYWDNAQDAGLYHNLNSNKISRGWIQDDTYIIESAINRISSGGTVREFATSGYLNTVKLDESTFSFVNQNVIRINGAAAPQPVLEESAMPDIEPVHVGIDFISGYGITGSEINITLPDGMIIPTMVGKDGFWFAAFSQELFSGDAILVTQTQYGLNESSPVTTIVIP